ncbi:IS110 family transposase [Streptomyces sp. Tu 3180]|uniref:IS110 family transposase n=1 Tax=Streptomyces sp. Tu 3180 TaxID=2682611 RepID=UPI00326053EA
MDDIDDVGVLLGLDVGKSARHGHGLTPAGKKVFDKQLPNSEPKLRAVFDKPAAKFGTVLVIVDQPASIGALPLTVARDAGRKVAHLPGLSMRRIADLYPGEAKTDAKDAAVIADAARTMPHTLRSLQLTDEITTELTVLVGFDQDLAAEATRTSNRIRGLLTPFHPSPERVLGPRLDHPAVTWRLERYGSPAGLRKAGRRRLVEVIRPKAPRMAQRLIDEVFGALDEQTAVVPGHRHPVVIPSLARSLAAVHEQRRALEAQIGQLLEKHPLSKVLTSIPSKTDQRRFENAANTEKHRPVDGYRTDFIETPVDGPAHVWGARSCTCTTPQIVAKIQNAEYPAEPSEQMGPATALFRAQCRVCGGRYDKPWRRTSSAPVPRQRGRPPEIGRHR